MKIVKNILTTIVIIFLFLACSHNQKYNIDSVPLATDINQFVDSIEIVALETVDKSLISEVRKTITTDSLIYVLDGRQNSILMFSDKGHFLAKQHAIGHGPKEYPMLLDFIIDETNGDIHALAPFKILIYSKKLKFKKAIKIPYLAHFFNYLDSTTIVFYQAQEEKRIRIYSLKTKQEIGSFHAIPKFFNLLGNPAYSPFYKENKILLFQSTSSNDVFLVTKDGLKKHYSFFPDTDIDLTTLPPNKDESFYILYTRKVKFPIQHTPAKLESTMQCALIHHGKYGVYLISRLDDSKIKFYNERGKIPYLGIYADSIYTYGCMEPDVVVKMLHSEKLKNILRYEQDIITKDLSMQNPFLVKYYIKKSFNENYKLLN